MSEKEYVIVNKGRTVASLRLFTSRTERMRMEPSSWDDPNNWYYDLGSIDEDAQRYYEQLKTIGLHLITKEDFNRTEDIELEYKDIEEENVEDNEEDSNEEEITEEVNIEESSEVEENQEESEEESNEDNESMEVEEDIVDENQEESDLIIIIDDEEYNLDEMEESELRDLGEELGIGNYWNRNIGNLQDDIIDEVSEE